MNYKDWLEFMKFYLAISNINVEDELPKPKAHDKSSDANKVKHEKWAHANKVCLMTLKYSMDKTIKDNILETNSAKEFLESIGKKFKKFDKTEKVYYLSLLRPGMTVFPVFVNMP